MLRNSKRSFRATQRGKTELHHQRFGQSHQFDLSKNAEANVTFEEVYDNYAIRIIYKSDPRMKKFLVWKIYSIVTDLYQSNPSRMRDWISQPRSTGYESLHFDGYGPDKNGLKFKSVPKE